jgi:DNA polymerase I
MLVTQSNFEYAYRRLEGRPRLVWDVETTGLRRWHEDRICGYGIAAPGLGKDVFYFPVRHEAGENLTDKQHKALVKLGSNPNTTCTGWNIKFDIEMGLQEGIPIPERSEDVMLSAHLLNENERDFKLKSYASRYIDESAADEEKILNLRLAELGLDKGNLSQLPPEEVEPYACNDLVRTEQIRHLHMTGLRDWGLTDIWQEVNDYMLATCRMEQRGMLLDQELVHSYIEEAEQEEDNAYQVMRELAGYDINPRSNPQMQAFLGMKSTRRELLEEIREGNPVIDSVIAYRSWNRAKSSYYLPYLEHVDPHGLIHPNLNLHGTVSGRPSASNPNMQAVPRLTHIYKVKDVFLAQMGRVLASADYSQAELRLGSWYAKEREMIKILNKGGDIHAETALILGIDRDTAKRINFGVIYGIGYKKLARTLRIPLAEADNYLDIYHSRFRNFKPFYRHMQMMAQYHGYIRLWTGRVRRYNTEYPQPHKALSNLVQGGVSEIMRHAILRLDKMVQAGMFHMLLQVHDQILFDIPRGIVNKVLPDIQHEMTNFPKFKEVPVKVDITVGKRWGKLRKWGPDDPYRPKLKRAA